MKQVLCLFLMVASLSYGFTSFAQNPDNAQEQFESQTELVESVTVEDVAVGVEVPTIDAAEAIADLVTNWKTMSPLAIGSTLILLLIQLLKSSLFGRFFTHLEYKRLFITVLGVAYGAVYMVSTGTEWVNALVITLISTGGAVAIYEALKPILNKKEK